MLLLTLHLIAELHVLGPYINLAVEFGLIISCGGNLHQVASYTNNLLHKQISQLILAKRFHFLQITCDLEYEIYHLYKYVLINQLSIFFIFIVRIQLEFCYGYFSIADHITSVLC